MVNFMFEKTVFVRENFTLHSKVSLDYIISLMPEKNFGKKAKKMKIRQVQKSLISALRNFNCGCKKSISGAEIGH